jgi:hypothetical protein
VRAAQRAAAGLARYLRIGVQAAGGRWEDTGYVIDAASVTAAPTRRSGILLDAGYLDTVLAALADAGCLRHTVGAFCADCEGGTCPDHLADRGTADRYDSLAARLRRETGR